MQFDFQLSYNMECNNDCNSMEVLYNIVDNIDMGGIYNTYMNLLISMDSKDNDRNHNMDSIYHKKDILKMDSRNNHNIFYDSMEMGRVLGDTFVSPI